VELAISSIAMLILVFGVIDLGRAYFTWQSVKNSAREGAAFAERNPLAQKPHGGKCTDPDNIEYRARTEQGSENTDYTVTVSPAVHDGCEQPGDSQTIQPGATVTVRVTAPFRVLTPIVAAFTGSTVTIGASQSVVFQG